MNWFGKRKTDLEKLFASVRSTYMQKDNKTDESLKRMDALLVEKLREEGIDYQTKTQQVKSFSLPGRSFFMQMGMFGFIGILLFLVWEFSPATYLPFIRIFSQQSTVDASLVGVPVTAAGVEKDLQSFSITLDKPVSEKFITETLKVSPAIAYDLTLKDDNKTIVITPKELLTQGEVYSVTLEEGTVFTDGTVLSQTEAWVLPVKKVFSVNYISPSYNSGTYESSVEIYFSEEISRENFEKSFSILPKVSGKIEAIPNNGFRFTPTNQFVPGTQYQVTLNSELTSASGSLLQTEVLHSFVVSRKGADSEYDGREVSFDSPYSNISTNTQTSIFFKGFIEAKQTIYEVSKAEVLSVLGSLKEEKTVEWDNLVAGKKEFSTKNISLTKNITLNTVPSGLYIMKLQSLDRPDVQSFQVLLSSQIVYRDFLDANTGELHIWSDKKQGLSAFGYRCNTTCEIDKQVDISETAYLSIQTRDLDFVLLQDVNGFVFFPTGEISTLLSEHVKQVTNVFDIDVNYEKSSYRAGETITLQAFLKKYTADGPKLAENEEIIFSVCTKEASDFCYQEVKVKTDADGKLLHVITTNSSQKDISIKILKSYNGVVSLLYEQRIELTKSDAPLVTINTNKAEYEATEIINVRGSILTLEGFPYTQEGIIIEQSLIKNDIAYDESSKTIRYSESDITKSLVRSSLKVSAQGSYILDIPLQTIRSGWSAYTVQIAIILPDGQRVEKKVLVTEKTLVVVESQQEGKVLNAVDILKPASIIIRVINKETASPINGAIGSITLNNTLSGITRVVQAKKEIEFTANGKYVVDIKSFLAGEYVLTVDLPQLPTIIQSLFTIPTTSQGIELSSREAVVGEKIKLRYKSATNNSQLILYSQSSTYSTWQNISGSQVNNEIQVTDKMVGNTRFCMFEVGKSQHSYTCEDISVLREQRKYDLLLLPVMSSEKKVTSIEAQLQSFSGNDQNAVGYYTIESASGQEVLKESTPVQINVSRKTIVNIADFSNTQNVVVKFFVITKDGEILQKEQRVTTLEGISFVEPQSGYNKNQTRIPLTFKNNTGSDFSGTAIVTCSECTPTQSIISVRLSSGSQETYEASVDKSLGNSLSLQLKSESDTLITREITINQGNTFSSLHTNLVKEEYEASLDIRGSKIDFSFSDTPMIPTFIHENSLSPLLDALVEYENGVRGADDTYKYQFIIDKVDTESRRLVNKQTIVSMNTLREWLLISQYIQNSQSTKQSLERVNSYLHRVNLEQLSVRERLSFLALKVALSQKKEYSHALTVLQETSNKEPSFEELLLLAEVYHSMGSLSQARDKLEQVISMVPQQTPHRVIFSRIYLLSKELQIPENTRQSIRNSLTGMKVFEDKAQINNDIESVLLFNKAIDKSDYGSTEMQIKVSVDDESKILQFTEEDTKVRFDKLASGSKRIKVLIPAGRKIFVTITESE